MIVNLSRIHAMEPTNSTNLNGFLEQYERFNAYYLIPALISDDGSPELLTDLSILKHGLHVRDAWQVGLHDEDIVAIKNIDKVIIPDGVENAPCLEIQAFRK